MNTTIIGDKRVFAIEYSLDQAPPAAAYGHIRLWLGGMWVGDIEDPMFLYHMCSSLNNLRSSRMHLTDVWFPSESTVPPLDELRRRGNWSYGESFDAFSLVRYAIQDKQVIHFVWELYESHSSDFPGYPSGTHDARVPFSTYDSVVTDYLRRIGYGELLDAPVDTTS